MIEVLNTYISHKTKFQEVSFQYQLIQLITVAISSLKYVSGQYPIRWVEILCQPTSLQKKIMTLYNLLCLLFKAFSQYSSSPP